MTEIMDSAKTIVLFEKLMHHIRMRDAEIEMYQTDAIRILDAMSQMADRQEQSNEIIDDLKTQLSSSKKSVSVLQAQAQESRLMISALEKKVTSLQRDVLLAKSHQGQSTDSGRASAQSNHNYSANYTTDESIMSGSGGRHFTVGPGSFLGPISTSAKPVQKSDRGDMLSLDGSGNEIFSKPPIPPTLRRSSRMPINRVPVKKARDTSPDDSNRTDRSRRPSRIVHGIPVQSTPKRVRRSLSVQHQSPLERGEIEMMTAFGRASSIAPRPLMPSNTHPALLAVCSNENLAALTDDSQLNERGPVLDTDDDDANSMMTSQESAPTTNDSAASSIIKDEIISNRSHNFQAHRVYLRDLCDVCGKKFAFSTTVLKCSDCRQVCHDQCHHRMAIPCAPRVIALPKTVGSHIVRPSLADWCNNQIRPMVPYVLISTISYLDRYHYRSKEAYRMAGSEVQVNELMAQFRNQRMSPVLSRFEPASISSCIKRFIKDLQHPLISATSYQEFAQGSRSNSEQDRRMLANAFDELPWPNRDTLSFILLHLKHLISYGMMNGLSVDIVSRLLGPVIADRGERFNNKVNSHNENDLATQILRALLEMPDNFYSQNLHCDRLVAPASTLRRDEPRTPRHRFTLQTPKTKSMKQSKSPWKG